MKVITRAETKPVYQIGDIVMYDDYACMIALDEKETFPYELVCVEGTKAGRVLNAFKTMASLQIGCSTILLKHQEVVISSGVGE